MSAEKTASVIDVAGREKRWQDAFTENVRNETKDEGLAGKTCEEFKHLVDAVKVHQVRSFLEGCILCSFDVLFSDQINVCEGVASSQWHRR